MSLIDPANYLILLSWRSLRDSNPGNFATFRQLLPPITLVTQISHLIFLCRWAREDQNQRWSRERYQAVAQRPELAHFELVHIAPFDPAVFVGPRRLPTVPEPRNSPGCRVLIRRCMHDASPIRRG